MKNILFIISMCLLSITASIAQSTTPRYGITKNQDNTYRQLSLGFVNTAEVAGSDTVKLLPNAFETLVIPSSTITDSISYSLKNLTTSYAGDELKFSFTNSTGSGHKVKFVGTGWQFGSGGSSMTLTTAKRACISFRFDGAQWLEITRIVQ